MATLGILRRGAGDPTYRLDPDGTVGAACAPPRARHAAAGGAPGRLGEVHAATAWGPGAEWVLASVPALLGADDDVSGFEPATRVSPTPRAASPAGGCRAPGWCSRRSCPPILEQKVTGQEAFGGYRHARAPLRRAGARAGRGAHGLWVPPTPRTWARIPSWEWLQRHVDGARSRTVVRAAAGGRTPGGG